MKMQRKWRRTWLRGKRSYYREWWLGQKRQKAIIAAQQQKKKQIKPSKRLISWASPAAAAAIMFATLGLSMSVASAEANNITITGKTATTITLTNANITDISTTTMAGINALNSFDKFNVGGGNTVNLHLNSNATNLINLVSGGQSQINGILNSIKDNKIGGNVFFLNPSGLVVGASGSVNVGSLTVYTPTTDFVNNFLNSDGLRDSSITQTTGGTLPISASGLISIEGTVNGISGVKFGGGTSNPSYTSGTVVKNTGRVNVGASFNTSASQSNLFDSVVNMNAWGASGAPVTVVTTGQTSNVDVSGSFTNQGQITSGGANSLTLSVEKDLTITSSGSVRTIGDLSVSAETVAISGQVQTGGGNFTLEAADSIKVSDGAIISTRKVPSNTLLADHEKSSVLSTGNSGKIDLKVDHKTYVGTATIAIDGNAKLLSFANNGQTGGDISVVASSEDKLYAWAMTGPDAKVTISNSLLKGENITIEAVAKNNANNNQTTDESANVDSPENAASLEKLGEEKSDSSTGDSLVNTLANLRVITAVTNVHAKAEVVIDDQAKLQADKDIKISTEAVSAVNSTLYSMLGGAGVALSDTQALTNIKSGAEIQAGGNIDVLADTENTIDIVTKTPMVLADSMPLNVMVSYAQMTSNASAVVGAGATIVAGEDLTVKGNSIKEMAVEASATDKRGYFSAGVAISNSDVNANAQIAGKVTAGNVVVDAKVDTKENTTWSDAIVGDGEPGSGSQLAADWMLNGVGGWMKKTLELGKTPKAIPPTVGVTGAIAVTLSDDTATASITSTGTTALVNGNLVNNAVQSLGKVSVTSDVTAVMQSGAIAEQKQREENSVLNQPTGANEKVAGVSAAVIYGQYSNTSIANIGDGAIVDAKGELTVDSSITVPFENKWADISELKTNLENAFNSTTLGIEKAMFTSWAQSSSEAEKGAGSASVDIMNYRNISKAYIGQGALVNQDTVFNNDQTANSVSVTAKNDITTLNMAGMFKSPLEALIKASREKGKFVSTLTEALTEANSGVGIGGSVLVTLEDNTTQAYIDTGSKVKASDLTVEATTNVKNISLGEAGGKAENIGFNGTATVNLISNTTYAKIINAGDVTASHDVTVKAIDDIYNINAAGGITESTSVGVGVSIAYNDIQRDTQAGVSGNITAGNKLTVNGANTGGAVTVSLAGSVTKDEKTHLTAEGAVTSSAAKDPVTEDTAEYIKTLTSTSGSEDDDNAWQDYRQAARDAEADANSHSDQPTSNHIDDDDSAWQDYKNAARDNEADTNNPVDKIEEKIPEANTKDEHGHHAKAGVSISGNVSINFLTEQALAFVGDNSAVPVITTVTAKTSNIQAQNGSSIYAMSGTVAVDKNVKSSSTGIAGAFMMNEITEKTQAYTKNATMNVTGTNASDALSIQATNNSEILSIAASGSVAPHGNAIAGQVSLNMMNNGTLAYVDNSDIKIAKDMMVTATDNSTITAVGGTLAYGGSVGIGASIVVNLMENTTEAYGDNSHITGSNNDSDISIKATEESDIVSVSAAISAGVGSNMTGAFSSSGNALTNTTKAYVAGSKGGGLAVDTRGSLAVGAEDKAQVTSIAGAGALDISSGGVGIGASAAVLVTNNTVNAYIDDNTQIKALGLDAGILVNDIPSVGLSITATSNETILSTAAGGAGAGTAGIAGSASTNVLTQTTDAHIGKNAKINGSNGSAGTQQDVTVTAGNTTNVTGLAGALAVGLTAGVGAAADVEVITGTTTAYIDSGSYVKANNNVIVTATSQEEVTSFAGGIGGGGTAGVAGSASVHVMNTDTEAFIGRTGDTSITYATVNANDSVALSAKDNSTLNLIAGSVAYGGTAGIDASVGTAVITKKTMATIGDYAQVNTQGIGNGVVADLGTFDITYTDYSEDDINVPALSTNGYGDIDNQAVKQKRTAQATNTEMKGVAVTAVAQNTINTVAVGAGASGTLAVTGSAAVNSVTSTTSAHVGKTAQIQANSNSQSVLVAAGSDYAQVGVTGALAGSFAAGVGAGATVTVVNNTTIADIDQKSSIVASGDVTVKAIASQNIISVAAALGASGEVGVAGGVTTNVLTNHTVASIGAQSHVIADNNVSVTATDTTEVVAVSGGVGIGLGVAGFGGSVAVTNIHKDTQAYIDDNATVDASAKQAADTLSVYTGDQDSSGKRTMKTIQGVSLAAQSSENITDVVASGGFGLYAGVAGSVAVNVDESNTTAYVGKETQINTTQSGNAAQAVSITAVNDVNMLSVSGAVGGGFVGVAGGVDVGIVKNATTAYVGYHAEVYAKDTVDVNALTTKNIDSYAASFSGGAVGVAGSVSVYAIGDNLDSDATNSLKATKDGNDKNNPKEDNVQEYADDQMQTTRYADMLSSYQDEDILQAGTKLSEDTKGLSVSQDINNTAAVSSGTTASIQGLIQSGGALSLGARGDLTFKTGVGAGGVGAAALGGAVSVVSVTNDVNAFIANNSPIKAKGITINSELNEKFTDTIVAGGVGMGGSIAGAVSVTNDNSSSKAYIGNTNISSGDTLAIKAKANHNMDGTVVGASAALTGLALSGAVLTDNVSGTTQAYSIGTVETAKDILVQAQTDTTLDGSVVAPSAGAFAGGAAVTTLTDKTNTEAFVSNQIISDSGMLTVKAAATSALTGNATGVGVGGIGVGVAVVDGTSQGQSQAYIGDESIVNANTITIQAERTDTVIANTTAGSAGGIVVGGSVATATVKNPTQAYTGSNVTMNTPGMITIAATSTPMAVVEADGYNFGALSVGVSVATGTVNPIVDAHLGSGNQINSKDMTIIAQLLVADDGNSVYANATASGGGLIGVNATESYANETAVVASYVGDNSLLTMDGDLKLFALGNSKQQANSSAYTGGIIAVGVNGSEASVDSTTTAYLGMNTHVNGGTNSTISVFANGTDETLAEATAGTGGVISGSAATATTTSTSDTEAYIGKAKDTTHINVSALGLGAQHTGTVNSHVDSTNASVAGGSGATATNTEDATVKVALNGNINTPKLVVKAINHLLKPTRDNNGYNVEAGSGGLLNGAAAQENTFFTGSTQIMIGDGTTIAVKGDKNNPNDTIFEALTNVDGHSSASLSSGGLIETAKGESNMTTTTNTGVSMGNGAHIDSVGDVTLAAYTTATTETNAEVNVYGLAGGAQGATKSTVESDNTVLIDKNALIRVDGNINLYAGRSASGTTNVFTVNANTDLYNDTVIPMSGSPKADVSVTQTDTINIAKGASLRSVGDVNLLAEAGTVNAVGYGSAKDLYDEALNALFGSNDTSYGTEYHSSSSPVATRAVTVDGSVETGIQNKQYLRIDAINESDINNFTLDQNTGNGQAVFTVKTTSSEGITYTITKENLATNLLDYRKKLVDLKNQYAADQKVSQAYASDIAYVDSQLDAMGLMITDNNGVKVPIDSYAVYYLTVNDVKARGGNINVTASTLTGSGGLQAPKDSAITIINNSPLYLRTKQLLLADTDGRVNLNGVEVNSAQEITNRNQDNLTANLQVSLPRGGSVVSVTPTVNTITVGSTNGVNSFSVTKSDGTLTNVTMDAVTKPTITLQNNDTAALNSGKNLQTLFASAPNIQISDNITNSIGSVSIYNAEGSILMQGENGNSPTITANEVHINATNGSVYQSYTPGLTSIGGDPESLWTQAVSGLESTDNKNSSSTYSATVSGQGGIYANGTVFISGEYLNINGMVQSGVADWGLTLSGNQTYSGTGNLTLDQFIDQKQTEWINSGKDPNAKYQISAGVATKTGTIASYYNPSTKQIELDGVTVQGGRVELYGQIMNTSGGNINAIDGYGNINITNKTNYNVVVNTLNTGNNIHGVVKITDTGKKEIISGQDHYLITQYERNAAGKVQTTTSHTGLNDAVTTLSGNDRFVSDGYSPVAGTRYVWTLGQDKTITIYDNFDHIVGGWGWDPFNWVTNDSDKTSSKTVANNLTALPNGTYATVDTSSNGTGLVRTYKNNVVNQMITEDQSTYSDGFLDFNKHYVTNRQTKTGSTDVYTYSAKADYPIGINFIGYDASNNPSINISGPNTSTGNVIINNSLTNQGGSVLISRPNSSILSSNTDAVIMAQNIRLESGGINGIGTAAAPIGVQLVGDSGVLNVHTEGGDINLNGVNGDLRISYMQTGNSGSGKVRIAADGSIVQATAGDTAVIVGSAINLTSATGTIGTTSQPLNVIVTGSGATDSINATAAKDISLRQDNGDFRLGHIESLSGDVTIEATNGSLVDANPIDAVDTRTLSEMNALWDRMQVKQGSGATAANSQTLTAYANGKQAAYSDYWRMRHVTTNYDGQGNVSGYSADDYNPNYTYSPTDSDKAMFTTGGLTADQQQQYINGKTQTYLSVSAGIGSQAVYNPTYTYTITDADRANLTTKGWTDSQLKYSIDLSVAKQTVSTDTTLQDPNVMGNHVKLLAARGGVGMDNGEIVINPNDPTVFQDITNADGTVTPSAARLALASAEGDDITIDKNNRIHVAQRQAIYVQSKTVEAEGQKNVYIGSASPIYVKNITSGAANNGVYDGTIRIKGKAGLYDVSTSNQGAIQGGRTVIEAGYSGTIGTEDVPFSVKLAEGAALTARSAGNIYIDSKGNNLYLAEIYSEGDVWLHAPDSILTNTNSTINSVATQGKTITLIADRGTLGTVDKSLLVNADAIIASGTSAVLEGQVNNSIDLNANQVTLRNVYSNNIQPLEITLAGYGKDMADSATIAVTDTQGVVFDSLNVNNATIDAYATNLSLHNTTIGTLASISNNSFTTIAGTNLNISQLSDTRDVLLNAPDWPFYLRMNGNSISTDGMILGHGTHVFQMGTATNNNMTTVVHGAMNIDSNTHQNRTNIDRQKVLQSNGFRSLAQNLETKINMGTIESAMQFELATGNGTEQTVKNEDKDKQNENLKPE